MGVTKIGIIGKRVNYFIKNHIAADIYATSGTIQALEPEVIGTISKKHAPSSTEREFSVIVGVKIRPIGATEKS